VHSPMSGAATAAGATPARAEGTGRRRCPRRGLAARPGGAGTAAARRWPRGSRVGTPHAWPRSRPQAAARTPRGQGSPSLQSRPASAGCRGVSLPGRVACAGHHCFRQQQGAALPPGLDECMPWGVLGRARRRKLTRRGACNRRRNISALGPNAAWWPRLSLTSPCLPPRTKPHMKQRLHASKTAHCMSTILC